MLSHNDKGMMTVVSHLCWCLFVLILRLSTAVVAVMKFCPNEYEIQVICFVTSSSDLLLRYV